MPNSRALDCSSGGKFAVSASASIATGSDHHVERPARLGKYANWPSENAGSGDSSDVIR